MHMQFNTPSLADSIGGPLGHIKQPLIGPHPDLRHPTKWPSSGAPTPASRTFQTMQLETSMPSSGPQCLLVIKMQGIYSDNVLDLPAEWVIESKITVDWF